MNENVVSIGKKNYPQSNLEYALAYAEIGFYVFPVWSATDGKCNCRRLGCRSPGKHPVETLVPRGQDNATVDTETITKWWTLMPNAGIAVFLQPSGLMALDCDPRSGGIESFDEMEAKHGKITSDVMSLTQSGGWHMLFKLAPDANITLPGKFGAGLDCKRQGYIILPPSVGVVGKYEFEASSDPLDGCIPSPMLDFFGDYAHATTTPSLVSTSTRHITQQQAEELADALAYIPADERDMWLKIGMALHSVGQIGFTLWDEWSGKSSKYNAVDQIRVWRSFKSGSGLNYESVFFLASEHGFVNTLQIILPAPVPLESVSVAVIAPKTTTPPHLLTPPGILGTITAWINATSRKSQPQFDVQAAIAFCSTVMGRRYCTDQNNWPSLYLLNIGKSASGKEHAKYAVEKMLYASKLETLIGPSGYTSGSGVLSTLHRFPSHVSIIDEFGKLLEAASVKGNVMARSSMTAMMEAWGRCGGVMRPQGFSTSGLTAGESRKIEDKIVRNPALTLLCMTTPETFFESVGSAAASDGFLNRFLIVESDVGRQVGRNGTGSDVPQSVIDWAKRTAKFDGLTDPSAISSIEVTPRVIPISEAAQTLFDAFEQESIDCMDSHDETGMSEMFGRCCEQSMRLALIVAVGCDCGAVEAAHAQWAIDYIRHYTHRAVTRLHSSVSDSDFHALSNQVLAAIKKSAMDGTTERDLAKSSRKFRAVDKRARDNVLLTLSSSGDIVRSETVSSNGKKTMKWFAVDPVCRQ